MVDDVMVLHTDARPRPAASKQFRDQVVGFSVNVFLVMRVVMGLVRCDGVLTSRPFVAIL